MYSLGCVLYECLAGQAPFRSESLMGTLWAHVHDAPPPVSEVLDPVFATGMAKDPTDRYPTCRELIQACRGALGVSGEFPPPGGSAQVPLLRRREFLVGAGIAALAVAGAIPAVLLTRGGGKNASPPLAPPNALARIDAETNQVTHVVSDLPVTHALAAGEGAVWVLSSEGSAVLRVDPKTFAVVSQGVPGGPLAIAAGLEAVWVTTSFEGVGYLLSSTPRPAQSHGASRFRTPTPGVSSWPGSRSGCWPTTVCGRELCSYATRRRPGPLANSSSRWPRSRCRTALAQCCGELARRRRTRHLAARHAPGINRRRDVRALPRGP